MRAGLSLVVLLVTLGIVALLWKQYTLPAVSAGRKGQIEAAQIAGQDDSGMKFKDSFKLEPQESGSKVTGLMVMSVVPGGPMDKYFDLKVNDVIVEVGPQRVRDMNDFGLAEALVQQAFQDEQPLVVMRGGQQVRLPDSTATPTPLSKRTGFGALPGAPSPTPPTGSGSSGSSSLQNQLNSIQQGQGQAVPTH